MDHDKFRQKCKGMLTLVPTAFKKNYELDLEALREHVRYLVENKVNAVIPAGSTGKFSSMRPPAQPIGDADVEELRKAIVRMNLM